MIGLKLCLFMITDLHDGHSRSVGEDVRQLALAIGRKVHDDHIGEAQVVGNRTKKFLKGLYAAGRGANATHGDWWRRTPVVVSYSHGPLSEG